MDILKTLLKYLVVAALGAVAHHYLCPCPKIKPQDVEQVILRSMVSEILPDIPPSLVPSFLPVT